jgi:hypothetical protein
MPHYRIFLRGENFLLSLDGAPTRLGFYATRFVEARSREAADLLAVDLIRDEMRARGVLNIRDDPPRIYADEIEAVAANEVQDTPGFTFFPADGGTDA